MLIEIRGDRTMNNDRDVSRSFKTARRLRLGVVAVLISSLYGSLAYAQGGQTEVSKTTPSVVPPPPVATPAPPAPAPVTASKPGSPVGSGAQWQTNVAKPPQAAPEPVVESDQEVVGKVNDYFNKLTNLQGDFIQTDPDNRQKQGKFYLQRPGKVRFDYGAPSTLKIISDGTTLVIEDKEANQSDRYPLESTPFRLLLSETVDLTKEANILGVEQGPDTTILTLEDKKGDGSGRIRLFFNKADMTLKQWIVTDPQGLDTRIEVANLVPNKQVSADIFQFSRMVGFGFEKSN